MLASPIMMLMLEVLPITFVPVMLAVFTMVVPTASRHGRRTRHP
jgi:hypothetical protein